MNRRVLLRLCGAGVIGLGGCNRTVQGGGLSAPGDWLLDFRDRFGGGGLDGDNWGIGWGWGRETENSPTTIAESNVTVENGRLRLAGTNDGGTIESGAIHSKNRVTFGPGSYLEARIKFATRDGFLNAFWGKPNNEAWPPEIDVVEQWYIDDDSSRHSQHHLHYSGSTEPGDDSTHESLGTSYEPGDDLGENFHVYGLEWRTDRLVHYVDGTEVSVWDDETMVTAMERGAPFYMMFSLYINKVGTADSDEPWPERMVVDWVRLWTLTN